MFSSTESLIPEKRPTSTTYLLHITVLHIWLIWNYLFPMVMHYMVIFNWKNLWLAIENLERSMNYTTSSLQQLRRVSIAVTTFVITLVISTFFCSYLIPKLLQIINPLSQAFTIEMINGRYKIIEQLIHGDWKKALENIGYFFLDFYEMATIYLFVLVTLLVSMSLQVIIEEVKNPLQPIRNSAKTQLMKWGQNYGHIFVFDQHINKCFGLFLLIFFLRQMIVIQDLIFVIINKMLNTDRVEFLQQFFILLNNVIQCLIISCASQNIKNKVFGNSILIDELLT